MPKYEIKKVSIWSFARTTALICGVISIGSFFLLSLFFFVVYVLEGMRYYGGPPLIAWLIALPCSILGSAVAGLAVGALVALIFNLLAPHVGGLEIDIEMKE